MTANQERREPPVERNGRTTPAPPPPETAERPVPGVEHKPEPDAENIMPAEDQPGTF